MRLRGSVATRLETLEAHAEPKVIGLMYLNAEWRGTAPEYNGMVRVTKTDEVMTPAAFERRYPQGMLIRVEYVKDWRLEA